MKKILVGLALALLSSSSALAADNALTVTLGAGTTLRSKDVGVGVQAPSAIMVDSAGTFVGAFANYGTAPGAVAVPGVNAFVTNTPAVSQSGTWNIGTVTTITNPVAATQSGTWNITNVSGTVSLPTGASTAALQPTSNAVAGTTTAGTTGTLAFGAVTTASPTYTTANTNPLSLDTTGALRVNVTAGGGAGGTSSTFGSAFPATGTAIGLTSGTNMVAWSATTTYGTAPAAIAVPAVNAFVTNSAPAGRTVNGLSANLASPVVQPSAPNSGATAFPIFSTGATTAGVSIKTSAAVVFGCQLANTSTTLAFVKIYNKASAATVGTDTPVKTLIVPGPAAGGGGSNILFGPGGFALSTGFSIGITALAVNSDTTAVASNNVVVNCDYE